MWQYIPAWMFARELSSPKNHRVAISIKTPTVQSATPNDNILLLHSVKIAGHFDLVHFQPNNLL